MFCSLQVIVVAFKNRKLPLPESNEELYEVYEEATLEKIAHTNQMRWLLVYYTLHTTCSKFMVNSLHNNATLTHPNNVV